MRKPIIAGNWKMHKTIKEALEFVNEIKDKVNSDKVEAVICAMSIDDKFIPPTINVQNIDEDLDLDYVLNKGREKEVRYAMSNSLGFGGHNATLVFKKY